MSCRLVFPTQLLGVSQAKVICSYKTGFIHYTVRGFLYMALNTSACIIWNIVKSDCFDLHDC